MKTFKRVDPDLIETPEDLDAQRADPQQCRTWIAGEPDQLICPLQSHARKFVLFKDRAMCLSHTHRTSERDAPNYGELFYYSCRTRVIMEYTGSTSRYLIDQYVVPKISRFSAPAGPPQALKAWFKTPEAHLRCPTCRGPAWEVFNNFIRCANSKRCPLGWHMVGSDLLYSFPTVFTDTYIDRVKQRYGYFNKHSDRSNFGWGRGHNPDLSRLELPKMEDTWHPAPSTIYHMRRALKGPVPETPAGRRRLEKYRALFKHFNIPVWLDTSAPKEKPE